MRITKREYDRLGGMRNSYVYRKQSKSGRWYYYCEDFYRAQAMAGNLKDD